MATQTARQRWLSVLAHSDPDQLRRHWQPLSLHPVWQTLRAPETGLARLQARIGATGNRFVLGDVTRHPARWCGWKTVPAATATSPAATSLTPNCAR